MHHKNYLEPQGPPHFQYQAQPPSLDPPQFKKPKPLSVPEDYYQANFNPPMPSFWLGVDRYKQNIYYRSNYFNFQRNSTPRHARPAPRELDYYNPKFAQFARPVLLGKRDYSEIYYDHSFAEAAQPSQTGRRDPRFGTLHIPKSYNVQPPIRDHGQKNNKFKNSRRRKNSQKGNSMEDGSSGVTRSRKRYQNDPNIYACRNVQIVARRVRAFWTKKHQSYPFTFRQESVYSMKFNDRKISFKMIKMDYNFKIVNPGKPEDEK